MTSSYDTCQECGAPVGPEEYGSYCPIHRLNVDGCCRNHCLIDEEGGHCIHCAPNQASVRCELCGRVTIDGVSICAVCVEDNSESPHVEVYSDLQDIISIARYKRNEQLLEDFKELISHFSVGYSPVLWAEKLLSAIMGSVFLGREENTIATDMDEFIRIVLDTLLESGTTKEDIYNKIEVTYIGEIKIELLKLIEILFANESIPDLFDDFEDEVEDFHESYQFRAPTREEQMQRLSTLNVQLCEECGMPCEFIWCNDCGFD